jgi:hypothetical protein
MLGKGLLIDQRLCKAVPASLSDLQRSTPFLRSGHMARENLVVYTTRITVEEE